MRGYKLLVPTTILLALTVIGTGCASPYSQSAQGITVTNNDTSGSTSVAASSSTSGGQAPFQVKIQGTGYDSHSVSVSVGTTLKVAFIPGKQNAEYSGTFYPYSMLAVYLGVGSNLQPTEMVTNGYGGGTARQSSVIDLSGSFTSTCSSSNTTCRQNVTVVVTQPNDDDACINQGYSYCPYNHVPSGHPWNGTLVIQTDDTTAI